VKGRKGRARPDFDGMPPGEVGCAYEIAEHVVALRELGGFVDEDEIADTIAAWWARAVPM